MPITINGNNVNVVIFNNTQVDAVTVNGTEVWSAGGGASELDFTVDANDLTVTLYFTQSAANAVAVDWGDGGTAETSGDTTVSMTHSYAQAGDYTVSLACADGETWSPGHGSTIYPVTPDNLTGARLTDSVTSIAIGAFIGRTGLTSVTIPDGVTSIENNAFRGCSGLTDITIPDSVTSIGTTAFRSCTSLESVSIGNSMSSIGGNAFNGCTSLNSFTVKAVSPPTLGSNAFSSVPADCSIYVPAGSVAAYQAASGWSDRAAYIQAIPA